MPATVTRTQGLELVRDLDVAPAGFKALKASERELMRYGLPRRPDEKKHPLQAALWESFASRPLRFVRPELEVMERQLSAIHDHQHHKLVADPIYMVDVEQALQRSGFRLCRVFPETSTNWSGATADRPASEPLMTVTGQWVVPSVVPPQSAWNGTAYNDGTYKCAVWVGLDGWHGTNDVLQAGTTSQVVVSGGRVTSTSYYAWIEWYGNPWTVKSDFPVNPGEAILCTVCAPFGNAHGTAMFVNQTTSLAMNYPIDPPTGVTLNGNVAEWIVEDPGTLAGPLFPFPNYGLTVFRNCTAGTKNHSLNLRDACPLNLTAGGKVISQGTIDSDTSLTCNFLS